MKPRGKRTLEHNQCRFRRLSVQPTLFGELCLMRGWDRIGRFGRRAMTTLDAKGAVADALACKVRKKQRHGYVAWPYR